MIEGQRARGALLERRIGEYFAAHGYAVRRNVILEGRSGGRHEIDVLAEKSDALTTYRVAIECKNWQTPIEKDVVSKLSMVLNDLALSKGIVVSAGGYRSGAELAGIDLGIDIWGPEELERRLGASTSADLAIDSTPTHEECGFSFRADRVKAETTAHRQLKTSIIGRKREAIVWFSPVWVPVYSAAIGAAMREQGFVRARQVSRRITNKYEALDGKLYSAGQALGTPVTIDLGAIPPIRPCLSHGKIAGNLRALVEKYNAVRSDQARARNLEILQRYGLPRCSAISIDQLVLLYLPAYVAIVQSDSEERVVALGGVRGKPNERLSSLLTKHLSHIRKCLA